MRKPLIVANWKMNHTVEESLKFLALLQKGLLLSKRNVDVAICPPHTALHSLSIAMSENPEAILGAQNCHWEPSGAYTGEISPAFLTELNCHYVIIGHSERRQLFSETDEMVAKKVKSVLEHGMVVILCVGETEMQRKNGETIQIVTNQLSKALDGVKDTLFSRVVIAYEPIWAIGTGNNATPEQAQEVHETIRDWVAKRVSMALAEKIKIIYGGSVKPENINDLMRQPGIDGALVGGASLSVDSFLQIVNYHEL